MAGRPIRRARLAAKRHQEEMQRLAELAEQTPPAPDDPDKPSGSIPPLGPYKFAWQNRFFAPGPPPAVQNATGANGAGRPPPPPPPTLPPLSQEEADLFTKLRKHALEKLLKFVQIELDPNDKNYARFTAKQLEICSQLASLSGRIDPSALKGVQQDTLGEMLAALKAEVPQS